MEDTIKLNAASYLFIYLFIYLSILICTKLSPVFVVMCGVIECFKRRI